MLTHDTIWQAIDRLAQNCGYSTSGLAKASGLDPTSFNKSKRIGADGRPRWPSTESIARILEKTEYNLADFFAFSGKDRASAAMIPLLSLTQAVHAQAFDSTGFPKGSSWEYVHFSFTSDSKSDAKSKYYALYRRKTIR